MPGILSEGSAPSPIPKCAQHGGDADASSEVLGVRRDGAHGLGRGLE